MRVVIIPVAGPVRVEIVDGSLDSLQAIVGGNIEAVGLRFNSGHLTAYVNEDGIALGHEPNVVATELAKRGQFSFLPGDYLKGQVVVVNHDDDWEPIDVTSHQLVAFQLGL